MTNIVQGLTQVMNMHLHGLLRSLGKSKANAGGQLLMTQNVRRDLDQKAQNAALGPWHAQPTAKADGEAQTFDRGHPAHAPPP